MKKIHNYEITLDEVIKYQTELKILINKLNNDCNPRNPKIIIIIKKKKEEKNKVLKSAKDLLDVRKYIIGFFENRIFKDKIKEMSEDEKKLNNQIK